MKQEELKQRLIELLVEEIVKSLNNYEFPKIDQMADHLIANGVTIRESGKWIDKPTGAYGWMQSWCSNCGKHSGIGGIESNRHKPICPNCGADMRGAEW